MQPTRNPAATLPDLLEVLLNKGVYLNLDLIISVADIPLIGVNLRATIAGIETMLEYGMMRQWDEQTRDWVQKSLARHVPLEEDEEVLAAMAGSHFRPDGPHRWRPGRAYLTTHRLILHRREPAETLWEAPLSSITHVGAFQETSLGGEQRTRLRIELTDGTQTTITAAEPEYLLKQTRAQLRDRGITTEASVPAEETEPTMVGTMWFLETLSHVETWRGGRGVLERSAEGYPEFTWRSPMDNRASLRLGPTQVQSLHKESRPNPTNDSEVLRIETSRSTLYLASPHLQQWYDHLSAWAEQFKEAPDGLERR